MNDFREYSDYLMHYGVPNMKWGRRRYQNPDGSLTPEGREHYGYGVRNDGYSHNKSSNTTVDGPDQRTGEKYKKLRKGLKTAAGVTAVAAGVALTAAALSNPGTREAISSAGKAAYSKIMNGGMENISGIKNFRDLAYTTNYADIGQSAARLMQKKQYLLEMKVA